jgi:hypothetical protein
MPTLKEKAAAALADFNPINAPSPQEIEAARQVLRRAQFQDARQMVKYIIDSIHLGEIEDWDALTERVHSDVDSSLIYTRDQWEAAYFLDDWGDPDDFGPFAHVTDAIAAAAFCNLEAEVYGILDAHGVNAEFFEGVDE